MFHLTQLKCPRLSPCLGFLLRKQKPKKVGNQERHVFRKGFYDPLDQKKTDFPLAGLPTIFKLYLISNVLSISAVQHSDLITHIYTHPFSHIMLPHVSSQACAVQQDLTAYPLQMQSLHLLTPNSQLIPLPLPPPWQPHVCSPCS